MARFSLSPTWVISSKISLSAVKRLAEEMIAPRIEEMKAEYAPGGWKPKLAIEKVIHRIFEMFPYTL